MLQTDVCHTFQFFASPYSARGIVWRTKEHHAHIGFSGTLFEVGKVNMETAIVLLKPAFLCPATQIPYAAVETVIGRRECQHTVTRPGKCPENGADGRHDTRYNYHPAAVISDTMPLLMPSDDTLIIGIGGNSIAKHPMLKPLCQCLTHTGSCLEVHIGYPHRIIRLWFIVPLHAARTASVDGCIKLRNQILLLKTGFTERMPSPLNALASHPQ